MTEQLEALYRRQGNLLKLYDYFYNFSYEDIDIVHEKMLELDEEITKIDLEIYRLETQEN